MRLHAAATQQAHVTTQQRTESGPSSSSHSLSHYQILTDTLGQEIGDIGGPSDTDQSALVFSRHTRRDSGLPVLKALTAPDSTRLYAQRGSAAASEGSCVTTGCTSLTPSVHQQRTLISSSSSSCCKQAHSLAPGPCSWVSGCSLPA